MIKSLAEKAKISVPTGLTPDEWIDRYNEILVGLVVQECIQVVQSNTASPNGYQALMKHFGVEDGK